MYMLTYIFIYIHLISALFFVFLSARTRKHWLEGRTLLVNHFSRMQKSTVSGYWEGYLEAMGASKV